MSVRILLLLIFVNFTFLSCKKDKENIIIKGKITNYTNNAGENNVKVVLYAKKIESGVYNANYTVLGRCTSSSTGEYSIEIENQNVDDYKITFEKDGFFNEETKFKQTSISSNQYVKNLTIYPSAWLKIHIKNAAPTGDSDFFSYNITEGYKDYTDACLKKSQYTGTSVNTYESGKIIGNMNIKIEYTVVKNNNSYSGVKTVYCTMNDTAFVEFSY